MISLFKELLQRHVARACHTRKLNVCVAFCHRNVLHEFKSNRCINLHKNIHVTQGDLSQGRVALCDRTLKQLQDFLGA